MALNPALRQLIQDKLAHTCAPQWVLPITEVRQAFRNLWTPAITGEVVSIRRIEDVTIPGLDTPIPTRVYTPNGPEPCPLMLFPWWWLREGRSRRERSILSQPCP